MAHENHGRPAGRIEIVLGRRRLRADQVARLAGGDVVELGTGPDEPVEVLLNGEPVGWGVPVEVDGHFAVRMTRMAGNGR